MMRNKPLSSMQKTYDECYLVCSTAVFFESQNNEAEALRSWKSALDQIHYHNAQRMPSGWYPKSETERALWDALKQMEQQCQERVDLLETLQQSRRDTGQPEPLVKPLGSHVNASTSILDQQQTWLGGDSIPPMQYSDIPSSTPSLPIRRKSSDSSYFERSNPASRVQSNTLGLPPTLPVPTAHNSRSPSPDARKPMRTTLRQEKKGFKYNKPVQQKKPVTMKAAGLAWDAQPPRPQSARPESDPTIEARLSAQAARRSLDVPQRPAEQRLNSTVSMPDPNDYITKTSSNSAAAQAGIASMTQPRESFDKAKRTFSWEAEKPLPSPPPKHLAPSQPTMPKRTPPPVPPHRMTKPPPPPQLKYHKDPPPTSNVPPAVANRILNKAYAQPDPNLAGAIARKPIGTPPSPMTRRKLPVASSDEENDARPSRATARPVRPANNRRDHSGTITPPSTDSESPDDPDEITKSEWEQRVEHLMENLPKGVDPLAAKNIINEIVVKGDEVHWDDVAGLDSAKTALKEAVVYPFLRPDLFMGLREPARGMLLFGPPGTGKTMLARAVATESKSTFFAISASSLTSKWHGESEKLVRALFAMAKALAPSIIFVDEIDSLLNSRGGGTEHEASRRSKTEFLIQWSDLQRAAAGKDTSVGDATRVLVLAATNCPWDIDDAARRRFVRRQYIPLPEAETREVQIRTLLKSQKHELKSKDIVELVDLTDGYSGSDITALCKDTAMQPLRSLGEALLTTPIDKIRPVRLDDFRASLESIRPSVSQKGLEEYDNWAKEFGEKGG